jgi:hypothetical protein
MAKMAKGPKAKGFVGGGKNGGFVTTPMNTPGKGVNFAGGKGKK